MSKVTIFTDGAVSIHGSQQGGWCAILTSGILVKEISGIVPSPTKINRVELTAVLEGLKTLTKPCDVIIHTDSKNVIGWLYGFDLIKDIPQNKKWKRKDPSISKLCSEIETVISKGGHSVSWVKVKGHDGDSMNERCDYVANALSKEVG